jgi:hypothetical protein
MRAWKQRRKMQREGNFKVVIMLLLDPFYPIKTEYGIPKKVQVSRKFFCSEIVGLFKFFEESTVFRDLSLDMIEVHRYKGQEDLAMILVHEKRTNNP